MDGDGKKHFVLSSSGNAAISWALYSKTFHASLDIFLSHTSEEYKRARLEQIIDQTKNIKIHYTKQPRKEAIMFAREHRYTNVLASKDEHALDGYASLGLEISHAHIPFDGVFMPVSTGTGLLGLALGLAKPIPLYAIQTEKVSTIASHFDTDFSLSTYSLATAISAHIVPKKKELIEMIGKTGGGGYVISDINLRHALKDMAKTEHIKVSYDSALAVAGLKKALDTEVHIEHALCILTGS